MGKIKNNWKNEKLRCSKCTNFKDPEHFGPDKRNKFRAFKANQCNSCNNERGNELRDRCRQEPNLEYYLSRLYSSLKSDIKRGRRVNSTITKKDLKELYTQQSGLCAVSGLHMTYEVGKGQIHTNISIDRKDCTKDYIIENVQLVCLAINVMKYNLSMEKLIEFCKAIIAHNED